MMNYYLKRDQEFFQRLSWVSDVRAYPDVLPKELEPWYGYCPDKHYIVCCLDPTYDFTIPQRHSSVLSCIDVEFVLNNYQIKNGYVVLNAVPTFNPRQDDEQKKSGVFEIFLAKKKHYENIFWMQIIGHILFFHFLLLYILEFEFNLLLTFGIIILSCIASLLWTILYIKCSIGNEKLKKIDPNVIKYINISNNHDS